MTATAYRSMPEMFLARVAASPDAKAFQYPKGGGWESISWGETGARVRAIASGLKALGLKPEERCAIFSTTRIEWILADLAILCAAGATTTIYPSNSAEDCCYILQDSDTVLAFVENDEQVAKLAARRAEIPRVKHLISVDGKRSADGWVITLDDLIAKGKEFDAKDPAAWERDAKAVKNDSLATLIYTSGTTGKPKGVELTHDCWVYEGEGIDALGLLKL
ncbi:MAG TPA: AMP-binding protein, partial [bacterium]|nr:AMP-binding protein [bacterium]